jgi:hypothetical protein
MIFFTRLIILFITLAVFFSNGQSSYAQDPVLLDKNLDHHGITSPIQPPANETSYYPDTSLPEQTTAILLIVGILLMITGSEFITGAMVHTLKQEHKSKSFLLTKHFGHSI